MIIKILGSGSAYGLPMALTTGVKLKTALTRITNDPDFRFIWKTTAIKF